MKPATLSILALLMGGLSTQAVAWQLNRDLPASDISSTPQSIKFLVYADESSVLPMAVADYGAGQFTVQMQGEQVRVSAEFSDELDAKAAWVELEVDGQLVGGRTALAIPSAGITFASGNHLDMSDNFIVNLATPIEPADAATKAYVDALNSSGTGTAAALAEDGSNCTSGYPLGVDQAGNAQECTQDATDDNVQLSELSELCQIEGQILKYSGGTWVCAADELGVGDNLGNHTAAANIQLNGYWLSSDGDDEGIQISAEGKVGIGSLPAAASLLVAGDDGLLATGTYGSGVIPLEGAGGRMMWYPGKGAFRAGVAWSDQWDDINIGSTSAAFGNGTVASGDASTALGWGSIADGAGSIASGYFATALGTASTAIGTRLYAESMYETVIGAYDTNYDPIAPADWDENDRLFVIGNGTSSSTRSDALVMLKSGDTTLNGNLDLQGSLDLSGDLYANNHGVHGLPLPVDPNDAASKQYVLNQIGAYSENDPTVLDSVKDGVVWTELGGIPEGFADGIDDGVTTESDPTVLASVKDGVSWDEVSLKPAGFADGLDDQGVTSLATGTGLTGGPITSTGTLSVAVPLALSGATINSEAVIKGTSSGNGGTGVEGRALLGYGVSGYGYIGGGLFQNTTYSGNAKLAYIDIGIEASGDTKGARFSDSNASGYADVGIDDYGIKAYGNIGGGYFKDLDHSGYAELGVGNTGVLGYGTDIGGYFEDTNSTGVARLAFNDTGVDGRGSVRGGYFMDSNGSGYSDVGTGDYGIKSYGNTAGGYFSDLNSGGVAFLGYGTSGVQADGAAYGGNFTSGGTSGRAVSGVATAIGAITNYGGWFEAHGDTGRAVGAVASGASGYAVKGIADATGAVTNYGGHFTAKGDTAQAVVGIANSTSSVSVNYGGFFSASSGYGVGVYGEGQSKGVSGKGAEIGVYGTTLQDDAIGVFGTTGVVYSGNNYGVKGYSYAAGSANAYGLYASVSGSTTGAQYAGYFSGDVHVNGTLSKSGGSFKIDHPLDPENKTLSHSFVESPDMMNIYNGNVELDERGEALVQLPDWFEALNRDFRYQLTTIGNFAPVYVAEEIAGNQFRIAGGSRGTKVSWQVTGIRHDAYAEQNRIPVEEDKPQGEQGSYLNAASFGMPEERSVEWVRDSKGMSGLKLELDRHPE